MIFNGTDLNTFGICGEPEITTAPFDLNVEDSPAFDGSRLIGTHLRAGNVTVKLASTGTALTRRETLSSLAQLLNVDEPKQLVLPDTPSWYYLAIPNGELKPERHIDGEIVDLSFMLVDPIAYGAEQSVTIPAGGSVSFTVDGTAPTYLYMSTSRSVTPDSSSKLYGLRLDNQKIWCVGNGGTSSFTINSFDFSERTLFIAGNPALPTLTSDWFTLEPGAHTIQNYLGGGNSLIVKYRERWL